MEPVLQNIIKVSFSLFIVFIVFIILTRFIMKKAFSIRSDGSPRLKYLQASNFKGLKREPFSFLSNKKQLIRGYLYYYPERLKQKELIIFLHGIGAGHTAYTTEINSLALEGYRVFAFDYTGCVLSQGQSIKNLLQPLVDLKYALRFINSDQNLKDLDIFLVGHSWGAFVALNALSFKKSNIKKVVAMSGFNNTSSVMKMNHPLLGIMSPFIHLYNYFRYGKLARSSSLKSLKKTTKEVLIIHGENDPVVKPEKSFELFDKKTTHKDNLHFLLFKNKLHNPYLSLEAEEYLYQVTLDKGLINKKSEIKDYEVDYDLITRQDNNVIKEIITFLKKVNI